MKKIISSIIIIMIILLSLSNYAFAAEQLQATIEITPSTTEVVAGDKVIFTFVTKNIVNSIDGTITAIGGVIEYDKNFFQLVNGGLGAMTVGEDTGMFNTMTVVEDGGTNGIITLKVVENPTGTGVVKFTNLEAGDGRQGEGAETLGTAKTADQEFTITLKGEGNGETPCEHTYGNYTDNGDGTHSETCTKCTEKRTEAHTYQEGTCAVCGAKEPVAECEHTYENCIDNGDGTHSSTCTKCGEKRTEEHIYQEGSCTVCGSKEPVATCEHTYGDCIDNEDGTHSSTCAKCGEKLTEQHTYEEGSCRQCNAKKSIPQAGGSKLLIFGILIIAAVAVVVQKKNQKYEGIK